MQSGEQASAEALLGAFKTIKAAERRKHASVLNYWLSIRGDKEFPPLHDLDPLELSDAGPNSALLELISGGHDAEIRHLGEALRGGHDWPERIMDAPSPSILACVAKKLPIVAISRDFLAFEDEFSDDDGTTRCWVTLLPLSAGGAWVDYVYALVSLESDSVKAAKPAAKPAAEPVEEAEETVAEETAEVEAPVEEIEDIEELEEAPVEAAAQQPEPEPESEPESDPQPEPEPERSDTKPQKGPAKAAPGFSKLFDSLAGLTGFHAQSVKVEPVLPDMPEDEPVGEEVPEPEAVAEEPEIEQPVAAEPEVEEPADPEPEIEEPVAEEPEAQEPVVAQQPAEEIELAEQPSGETEGPLKDKLTQVRAMADEARQAKLRANAALYEGLSAAYDFALDAEDAPEEYLRLVEAQGLKIQLRSPMKPVVKLAFAGMCDDATIKQLEAVLAWAFDQELPRGALAQEIETAGGIAGVLNGEKKAA
jgi:hypothetical protein